MTGDRLRVYWDACVLLSFIEDDPDRAPLIGAMMREAMNGDYELYTSVLSITEVAFATAEKKSAKLDAETLADIDNLWTPPSPLTIVELYPQIANLARGLVRQAVARKWSLKPPDAIHLATAKQIGAATFNTYDGKLKRWAQDFDFEVSEPAPDNIPIF